MKITRTKAFPRRQIQVAEGEIGSYGTRNFYGEDLVHFSVRQAIKGDDYQFEVELTSEEFEMIARLFAYSREGRAVLERAVRMGAETEKRSRR